MELERNVANLDGVSTSDELNRRTARMDKQIERLKDQVEAADDRI